MMHRLPVRVFYVVIVAGVVLGSLVCAGSGWWYLEFSGTRPTGRRVWDGVADHFVVPICVMIGSTFGGLLGLVIAIALDFRSRRRRSTEERAPGTPVHHSDNGIHSVTS